MNQDRQLDRESDATDRGSSLPAAPIVSVAITAYNSALYLARALDSVLMQRTQFPVEIVIGDDCSQDATVRIAESYQEKYPDKIRVMARPQNIGIQRNYYETFEACRGKYTAWLDADDFWTDPEKLAIQVKLMEENPKVNVCCHFVRWVNKDGEVVRESFPPMKPGTYGVEDILRSCFVPTCSTMYRGGLHRKLPDWYFQLAPVTDWPIWVLGALDGEIVLLDRNMSDYFLTPNSASTAKGQMFLWELETRFYERIESILPTKYHRMVRNEKGKRYEWIAYWKRQEGDFAASREAALKAFRSPYLMDRLSSKTKSMVAAIARETQWRMRGTKSA